eukprot:m51a1_g13158 hypothetical protein (375) ;mRNA; f:39287-40411
MSPQSGPAGFFLDKARTSLADEMAFLARALDRGKLVGNCWSRMVVGPRGSATSSFLRGLVVALQHLTAHTLCVWCDAGAAHTAGLARSPAEVICAALARLAPSMPVPQVLRDDIGQLVRALGRVGLRVLLVIDEFPAVYRLPRDEGSRWVAQVYALGQMSAFPQSHLCVLGASCPEARSLIFGKLPLDSLCFPSYWGRMCNLGSDRLEVKTLSPLLGRSELARFVRESWGAEGERLLEASGGLDAALAATGGSYGQLDALGVRMVSGNPAIELLPQEVDPVAMEQHTAVLGALARAMARRHREGGGTDKLGDDPWQLVSWVAWQDLRLADDVPLAALYAACNEGVVVYEESDTQERLRFASVAHARAAIESQGL